MEKIRNFSILLVAVVLVMPYVILAHTTQEGRVLLESDSSETGIHVDAEVKATTNVEHTSEEGDPDQPIITGQTETDVQLKGERVMQPEYGADTNSNDGSTSDTSASREQGSQHNQSDLEFLKDGAQRVQVRAVEVRGWDPEKKEAFLETVQAHAEVKSEQDLENFAKGVLLNDENVADLSADESSVEVRYHVPAKFLGFFKTTLTARVVAEKGQGDKKGNIKVKFPWFRFLFGVSEDVSKASLESDIDEAVSTDLDLNRDAALDVSTAARIMATISSVLKAKHDIATNSEADIQ